MSANLHQQHAEPIGCPPVPVTSPFVQAPTAPQRDGGQVAAHHGDPQVELVAALKDMRDACAALIRVVYARREAWSVGTAWASELRRVGVAEGFGARADAVILRAEGRL